MLKYNVALARMYVIHLQGSILTFCFTGQQDQ